MAHLAIFTYKQLSKRAKPTISKETVYSKGREEETWARIQAKEGDILRIGVKDIKEIKTGVEAMLRNMPSQPKENNG